MVAVSPSGSVIFWTSLGLDCSATHSLVSGKRQNEAVQSVGETKENEEKLCLFSKESVQDIGSHIAVPTKSVDLRKERS